MVTLLGLLFAWPGNPALAQDTPVVPAVAAEPTAAADATTEADGNRDGADKSIREQDIYIPYEKLRQVFEKHGRGVFLPYEKFQELWQAARDADKPAAEPKPPVGALITESDNEATVAKDVVQVKAVLKIEVLAEGWNEIPLRLADAAITRATLSSNPPKAKDEPARIVGEPSQGYMLLIEKKGKQPEQFVLTFEYAKAISRTPGQNSVEFQAPQAPVSKWRVRIPQAGVKVNIQPLIAATEEPAAAPAAGQPDGAAAKPVEETVVLAFVGAAPMVRIDWTPKTEGATGLTALASVQAEQQVDIDEGVTRTRTLLVYTISRAELAQLTVEVPADQKVVNVFDANVRQWSVEVVEDRQQITAQLFEPAKGSQQVTVELEKFAGDKTQDTLQVPVVKALAVGRQQGVVVVRVGQGLRAEATRAGGLLQVDAAELPQSLSGGKWDFSYRYASVPFDLQIGIEKVQPRILADTLLEAQVLPQQLLVDMTTVFTIQRAGVFRLEFDVPSQYDVLQVRSGDVGDAKAVEIDTHHFEGDAAAETRRLVVNLSRKAIGPVALVLELHKDFDKGSDLLTYTGKAVDIPLAIPRVAADTVERATGRLILYAPEALRVNPGKPEGLRNISFAEAMETMQSARTRQPQDAQPVLSFAYTQEPVAMKLAAERLKPYVTIKQLLVGRVENGVIKYRATFFYEVLYSGVHSLRIDIPTDVAAELPEKTSAIQKTEITPAPDDLTPGCRAWSFTGESELLGEGKIELVWEEKIDKLGIGKSIERPVPCLKPIAADRSWGQIVLAKAETIDVQEKMPPGKDTLDGLEPIDPQHHLMAEVSGGARAMEFHGDWSLRITITQYELEQIKYTSIERAVVRMVVTPAGELSVQALYRMRSTGQRLELKLPVVPPPGKLQFDTEPLRINGRPVTLERGQQGEYFVPLVDSNADQAFLLELRYTMPGDAGRLDLPVFPSDPAAQKVYLCVYLPREQALLGAAGPWTEEFQWRLDPNLNWIPAAKRSAEELVAWVCQDVPHDNNPVETFQTDGRLYVYSTLYPAPPPAGSLRMRAADEIWLDALVFAVMVLLGVALLPARTSARALAMGIVIVSLVLCGVFLPTLAYRLLNGVLASAIFVVLVLWVVWYFAKTRPGLKRARAVAVPPSGAAPTTPAASSPFVSTGQTSQPAASTSEQAPAQDAPVQDTPAPADEPKTQREKGGRTDA